VNIKLYVIISISLRYLIVQGMRFQSLLKFLVREILQYRRKVISNFGSINFKFWFHKTELLSAVFKLK